MENRSFYNEILTEHNLHPEFKHDLPDADIVLEGCEPKLRRRYFPEAEAGRGHHCGRRLWWGMAVPFLRRPPTSCWV